MEVVEQVQEWIQLREHPDYEIQNTYPFQIRKRSNNRILSLWHSGPYLRCSMNKHLTLHHRVIAEQFLANPDNLPDIDHINHVGDDNHLDNLRWVSHSENQRNRTRYSGHTVEYMDSLPDDAEPFTEHRNRPLAHGHFRRGNEFFVAVGQKYRRLTQTQRRRNSWSVTVNGPNGEHIKITWRG
jgi:hypothetical protein